FSSVYRAVIEPACLKCHSSPDNDGDVNLETYQEVFKHRVMIEKTVRDGSMPKKKSLSTQQKELLLQWLQAGASEEPRTVKPVESEIQEFDPLDPINLASTPRSPSELEKLSRGQYVYRSGLCANCHTADPRKPLAGGVKIRSPFGTFYAPNISQDRKTGIGRWSKSDFAKSMRHGVSPTGEYYYPSFPYQNYSKITDGDIDDLFYYLQAMPKVVQKNRSHKLGFPYNQRSLLGFWRALNFQSPFQITKDNFQLAEGEFQNISGRSSQWNRGAYLVEGALHCTQCHTPRDSLGSLKMDEWMAGARLIGEKTPAGNLTPHKRTGLGQWTEADWVLFLDTATTPDGTNMGGKMRSIVINSTAKLTLEDKKAIAAYFQSLKPVRNTGF
ncbi:MAG: cytochrome c, partial [Bdellovibrionales bacterium]|nr:cytochrome c [Bdellovibrionales bacterium]